MRKDAPKDVGVTLVELVHDGLLTVKEAAKRAGMSEEAFRKLVTR